MMQLWTEETLRAALSVFPPRVFRQNDAYAYCDRTPGRAKWHGTSLWHNLQKYGLIVRTAEPIGKNIRRCYWQRTPGSEALGKPATMELPIQTETVTIARHVRLRVRFLLGGGRFYDQLVTCPPAAVVAARTRVREEGDHAV